MDHHDEDSGFRPDSLRELIKNLGLILASMTAIMGGFSLLGLPMIREDVRKISKEIISEHAQTVHPAGVSRVEFEFVSTQLNRIEEKLQKMSEEDKNR